MMTRELITQGVKIANQYGIDPALFLAFMETETGGRGFDSTTGKLMIQFEPAWFKKRAPYAPSGLWSLNKVDVQSKEWLAFNDAFKKNAKAAMLSTSIGLFQIMGFNFAQAGFDSVDAMWNDAKKGTESQIRQGANFIKNSPNLLKAMKAKNFHLIATYYNGAGYPALAKKYGREPYNITMERLYNVYKKL